LGNGERLEFERLITTLSTEFINLSLEDVDGGINHALQIIGEFSGFDRTYVVLFSEDGSEGTVAYEWCAESVESLRHNWQQFSTEPYPWLMAKLRDFEAIQVLTLADLPAEAVNTRLGMESSNTQSVLVVPIVHSKSLIGYLAFAAVKQEKTWSDETVALLRIVGEIFANVLNRKQAESKLRESERRFRAVFNQTFQLSSLLKLDGTVLEDNQTAIDFCQLERSEMIGHPFWELQCWTISPETQNRLKNAIAQAAAGNVVRYEVDILAPDDTVVTIDFSLKPLKDETGQVELLIAEGRDLSEVYNQLRLRKRIEQDLQRAVVELTEWKNRYEAAGQINGLLLYDWNSETEEILWSQNAEQVLGYSSEELTGSIDQWKDRIHPDDLEKILQTLERVITTKEPLHIEYRMRQKDGTYITVEDKGQFYPDSAGNLNHMVGFVANITEYKHGDSALRESEERFRAVFDQAAVGISLVHPSGQFIGINQRYCDLVGYTKSEMLQLTFQEITYPEDIELNLEYRQQLYSGQIETFSMEKRYICKDGRLQWVNLTVSLMRDSAGVPKYTISVVEDIQERKQAEAALKESEERWQLALRGNNDSIWDLNFRTNQCFHSPRWGEMLGYEEGQSSHESDGWETRVHPDDIGRVMQVRQEHLQRKTPYYSAEYRIRCKDGSYKWILSRAQALWDEAGNPVRLVGSHTDISDRKQAEEALKASEEQFRSLSACSPVGIFLADVKGHCTYANPRLQEIVGLAFEQILGDGWTQAVYPDDREWVFAQWLRSVEAGQEDFKEYRFQTSEGIVRWVQVRSSPMHCAQGKLIGFVGTVEDINQRKQAEAALQQALSELEARVEERTTKLKQANEQLSAEIAERQHTELALRQSEEQFRRVFNEAPIGMSLENLDYRFIRVNRALCAMLGYTESELMALKCSDIVHPDDSKQEQPYFEQLLQGKIDSYQLEQRLLKKNQQILWVNVTTIVLRDEAGQVLYILGMTEDITERKQTEEALRQSEQQFRAIVEDQTELICRFKPDRTLTFVNGAYCRYFGKQHSELIGHRFDPEIPQDDQELVTQSFRSLSIEQPIVTYEYRVILPSGEIRWQQWTDRAMFDELGNLIEFQAVGRDITQLKQAEAEILKALEKERELSELRSSFMSLVSHEFRTPLTTIQSSAELLERYNKRLSEEKKHNHLIRIQSAVRRMTQLLDDVLTIGKAEAGKLRFEPVPMDLVAFCSSIVETMQISAGSQPKLAFVIQGECTNVRMDEKLLAHIVTNLLSNAIKYSPHGGTIQFDLVCTGESAVFRIRDSGIGIPQKDVEQLFESFMRASNVGSIPGTGLGLAIVKKCVDLHGGNISIDSEVGVGTTFTVTLPLNCW
jgi:PAS domain S-box-containing protein